MTELKHELTGIAVGTLAVTCGGNQMMFRDRNLRRCGCGIVGALDLLIYLARYHDCRIDFLDGLPEGRLSAADYETYAAWLSKHAIPVIHPVGVNAFALAAGMNHLFRRCRLPYRASWQVTGRGRWETVERMLSDDLPVIMSVGRNFPNLWGKRGLLLFDLPDRKQKPDRKEVRAHFFTVTGLSDEWMQISSWGRRFYIFREDYEAYVKLSGNVMSNHLKIERIK